jgi:4-oxalomesaconate tautomerase
MDQAEAGVGIRCMMMRGGTSKGAFFLADDLPSDPAERDELLLRIMGTPDPRQIDGMGGAHPLTSKVAVVAGSHDPRADVEYLFLQLGVEDRIVTDRQNCGNLLAAVGPFAVERGLVDAPGDRVTIGIHMLNTNGIARATFPTAGGLPVYAGATTISGVPGSAAAIRLEFDDTAGGTAGALLPTGSEVDIVEGVPCTLIDNGMPVVVMRASDIGVTGYETCSELEEDRPFRDRLEAVRLGAARLMGLGDVTNTTIPKLTLVSPPIAGGSLNTRTFIPHRCHDAIGVLGAVSVATAAQLPSSPAASVLGASPNGTIVLEHPTGTFEAVVDLVTAPDGTLRVERSGIIRTARKLMDGTVFPRPYA